MSHRSSERLAIAASRHAPRCPLCPGQGEALGTLGALQWYRCRDCGMCFYRKRAR